MSFHIASCRLSERTQEARRILLSDINFTSMVPELSRSADHLCQQKINEEADEDADYFKGNLLKTPDYTRGITPSTSMVASPGVSQWTVNESTTQTEGFFYDRGDSFDSTKSYSLRSANSASVLNKHHRSRSVPSIRCAICKQNHHTMKPSESMHYATRTVTFQGESPIRVFCELLSEWNYFRTDAKDPWVVARPAPWLHMPQTICWRPCGAVPNARVERLDGESPRRGRRVCAPLRWNWGRSDDDDKEKSQTMLWGWHPKGWVDDQNPFTVIDWLTESQPQSRFPPVKTVTAVPAKISEMLKARPAG